MSDHIFDYYKSVCEAYNLGNIETSYNAPIITLLTKFGCNACDMSGERSGQSGENIDIKLWRSDDDTTETEPFAGVEVKKVGGIDARAKSQIKTEAAKYGNAILTDNLVWEFWRSGEDKMYAGVQLIEKNGDTFTLKQDNIELFISLVKDFLLSDPTQIKSSNKLAEYMAMHARTIRDVIKGILKEDENKNPLINERQKNLPMFLELYGLYSKIKEDLRPAMTSREFADMYAQTIVYGLFIARYNDPTPNTFDRYEAIGYLQEESALLKQFFIHIASSGKKHPTLESVIDKLCALYRICNISELLEHDEQRDTIIHFYEEFLTYYDPALRKSLGVFYTPVQAVRYLVSTVDRILVEDFGIQSGLSNNDQLTVEVPSEPYQDKKKERTTREISTPRVAILDPACGTGSFHAEIIKYIKDTYFSGAKSAFYESYIQKENGLLSRMIAFEIMMTSYVVAHLKIRRTIDETLGHSPDVQLPTNIFLTNTLAPPHSSVERSDQISLFVDFSAAITDEAYQADTWKTRRPIKVIIGNPPYLAASTNQYDISAYRTETSGITFNEKNPKALGDDYVKFFRFSEQIVNKNNEGVLAFVSNNGYLDNPTFRGMRASLLRTFDKIYIVNLHGSATKQEKTPTGEKDENIFDIMQGISLFIGVKTTKKAEWAKVYYSDLWGTRKNKFDCLDNKSFDFIELKIDEKMAYFVPYGNDNKGSYENGISVAELFPTNVQGITSSNDEVAIALSREELNRRIEIVRNAVDEKPIINLFGKFCANQTAEKIQKDILIQNGKITPLAYRPFDERWTYYSGVSSGWIDRPREKKTMGHLLQPQTSPIGENIGLIFSRTAFTERSNSMQKWAMIFLTTKIKDKNFLQSANGSYVAPLYLYSEMDDTWTPNFDPDTLARLTEYMSIKPEPVEVFDYIYGILYDPVYRERFNEFLKRDFPRVPVVNNEADKDNPDAFYVSEEMFRAYVTAGERLRKLHLMQVKVSAELGIEPNTPDNMEIGAVKYKDGVLHLNANKHIVGIPADVWEYRIGGYQVLDKWFKSHKGEALTLESFEHIENVVGLLAETIRVQEGLRGKNI